MATRRAAILAIKARAAPLRNGAALAALGVSKRFGVVRALDDVTLAAPPGQVLALVGENGAGKSTLVRIFEGVYRPDQGTLAAGGVQQTLRSPADAHALGIRVIHQEPDIIPDLTIAENLFLGDFRRTRGLFLDRADLARRTRSLLAEFGLETDLTPWTRAGDLSPAQRQLMEIMRALRRGLKVLALDEPTSSLTEDEAQRLFRVVRRLRDDGVAIIYISHRMREVRDLADRIAVLRDGRLVDERPTAEFPEAEIVQAMVGRPISDLYERSARRFGEVALSVQGLTTARVHDVSFEVRSGEVVGLAGLIGAGRSELAEAIFGYDRMLAGSVAVAGRPVRLRSPADAIAAGVGFAPEDRKSQALLLLRSVKDNISLAIPDLISRLNFVNEGDERRIAGALVDRLRIRTPSLDASVANLSGGNQQKVVLGRWLARRPKVLILDEPTRGVDVGAKAEIYRLIAELAAEGIALLVISSEMPELLGLADRILVMAGGRVVAEMPREEASEERHPEPRDGGQSHSKHRGDGAMTELKIERASAATDRPVRRSGLGGVIERVGTHNFSLLIALAALIAIFGFLRPDVFFLLRNILNIGQAIAILGILATAQTIVIISGGLDISVGAVVGLSTVCIALAVGWTGSPALSILFGVVVGAIAGAVNGLIITVGRINAVIATLGTMAVFRGVAFIISNGQSISIFDPAFRFIGDGKILGVPVTILVLVLVVAIFFVLMRYTITGRNIYAIGGNPVVARLAGLNVRAYQIGIYTLSGATAGLAGMLLAARTGSGQPISGSEGLELEAITAAVLGGCALTGGKGTIIGGLLGVLIIGVLDNGLILTSVPTFFQMVAKGVLLIAAVIIAEQQARRYG